MNLAELSKNIQALQDKENKNPNVSILVYGETKLGKTRYVATLAKSKSFDHIYWFDGENGYGTLLSLVKDKVLTETEASKIELFHIVDLPHAPYFQETLLKVFTVQKDLQLCDIHCRVFCPICTKEGIKDGWRPFNLFKLGERDCVVIDSGSQFADSLMWYLTKGKELDFKPGWDEYGPQGLMLKDVLGVVQACHTNHVWITHQLIADDTSDINKDDKSTKEKFYPLIGTKNFSASVGKYFGHVVYLKKKLGKHGGGSASTFMSESVAGSRLGMLVEEDVGLMDFSKVLEKARYGARSQP